MKVGRIKFKFESLISSQKSLDHYRILIDERLNIKNMSKYFKNYPENSTFKEDLE